MGGRENDSFISDVNERSEHRT
jgi:jouberin